MIKCIICNQEINDDSQYINNNWYHNLCICNLSEKYNNNYYVKGLEGSLKEKNEQIEKYNNIIDKIRNKIKEDNEYLENAKEMYSEHDDELVKVATLQLINNNLVQNLELMMILEKAE